MIEGARIFDHLAKACKEILDRDFPVPSKSKGKASGPPTSGRPGPSDEAAKAAKGSRGSSSS